MPSNDLKKAASVSSKKKDIAGIFLSAFALILLIAFILGGDKKYVGAVGSLLSAYLLNFMGYTGYILPVILLWWAVTEFRHKKFNFKYSMSSGMVIMILGVSMLLHIIVGEGAGGMLGDFSTDVVVQITFGKAGAYIFSLALVLAALVLMADISIKTLFNLTVIPVLDMLGRLKKEKRSGPVKLQLDGLDQKKKIKLKRAEKVNLTAKEKKKKENKKKENKKKEKKKIVLQRTADMGTSSAGAVQAEARAANTDKDYHIPSDLLKKPSDTNPDYSKEEERGGKLKEVLANFGIESEISGIQIGPAITRYEITVPPDVKLSRIRNLESNIAMTLAAKTVRLLTPIPGKAAVGVEVPAIRQETVYMKTLVESEEFLSAATAIPYSLGKSVDGDLKVADLSLMPHLLLAGATGSGKSVAIHVLVNSILFKSSPEDVRFLMIDPKRVELPVYNGIPHLDCEVITDSKKAVEMLHAVTCEMDNRYDHLSHNNTANIDAYNAKKDKDGPEHLPRLVVVIDELADLMVLSKDKVESAIVRIAQMARAVGIHLVLATQRPSVDIITGVIKANLPARIAFNVLSGVDSRTILDSNGAEKLLGRGDMLYLSSELPQPERIQGVLITRKEVEHIVSHLINMQYEARPGINLEQSIQKKSQGIHFDDDVYPEAVKLVIKRKKASISLLQRRLRIGYTRAARIVDMMEDNGIVSADDNGVKGREVLVSEDYLENL